MARGTGESSREAQSERAVTEASPLEVLHAYTELAVEEDRRRLSTLAPVGTVKRRYLAYIARCREQVMERCTTEDDAYRCEGCQRTFVRRSRVLAHHHVFGRGKLIAEPLASHPIMGAGLCRLGCHREIHADIPGLLNKRIRIAALQRAWQTFGFAPVDGVVPEHLEDDALNGYARAIERMLKDDGTWLLLREAAGQ